MLDRVNSVPVIKYDFPFELMQWFANLVDTLNEVITEIENTNLVMTQMAPNTTQLIALNTAYIPTNAALVSFQLPAVSASDVSNTVEITGEGAGGWILLTSAGQTIKLPLTNASATTSVASANRYDSIKIKLVDATTWVIVYSQTTGFVIV